MIASILFDKIVQTIVIISVTWNNDYFKIRLKYIEENLKQVNMRILLLCMEQIKVVRGSRIVALTVSMRRVPNAVVCTTLSVGYQVHCLSSIIFSFLLLRIMLHMYWTWCILCIKTMYRCVYRRLMWKSCFLSKLHNIPIIR